ncbi:MAG: MBL fold metallo-hydrolase [Alphaproteobacteria bacterium]|nr:MBL fold metallo-hydrolase [Alphaproteobacteria bacterium]
MNAAASPSSSSATASSPEVKAFFDPATWTLTFVVWDRATKDAVIIDPVLDFDPLAVSTSERSATEVGDFVEQQGLHLKWILETHAHADHLSGSQVLKDRFGAGVVIGQSITAVQDVFKGVFGLGEDFHADGSQFDKLVADGEALAAGSLTIEAIATPGHTPACMTYKIGDAIFTGDALFMPDFGTGRCDFPKGSAEDLYDSIQKLYALPDETRVFVGHDYQPGGREVAWETTVGASKAGNKQLTGTTSREDFVKFRSDRDAQLQPPKLIFQSIQVNIRAGRLPDPEGNGLRYLKLPMGVFS